MKRVIFDTDIGIDDAMALLFLHFAPDVELCGIVTGFGNASIDNTTRNALYVSDRFGVDAPVYRGAAEALGPALYSGYPDFVHGSNGLGDIEIPEVALQPDQPAGAQAIVDIARRDRGRISIVSVGRLSNIAAALQICPELPELVRELIVMGGVFGFSGHRGNVSPVAEANVAGDPLAADIVFGSGIKTTIVGLDVTQQVIMDDAFFEALRHDAGYAGEFIYRISRYYLDFHERTTGHHACPVHDSSAVAYLLQPEMFSTIEGAVRVVTEGIAAGQTIWGDPSANYETDAWSGRPLCRICTGVDDQAMLGLYRDTLRLAVD